MFLNFYNKTFILLFYMRALYSTRESYFTRPDPEAGYFGLEVTYWP